MLFEEYMQAVADRIREPDLVGTFYQKDIPWLTRDRLEQVVVQSLNQVVREVPEADWDSFSSDAVKVITDGPSSIDLPKNFLRVLASSVNGQPAVQASVGSWQQMLKTANFSSPGERIPLTYTLRAGTAWYIAGAGDLTLTILVEPDIDTWKGAVTSILPPGYDIRVIDIAAKRILISDYVPEWRA